MNLMRFTRRARTSQRERRTGAGIAASALVIGLGLATLVGPAGAFAETADDSSAVVGSTAAPDATTGGRSEATDTPVAPGEDASTSFAPPAADALAISPLSVPVAPANAAVISVRVGGDRLTDGTVKGLPGVTLALYGPGAASTASGNIAILPAQGDPGARYPLAWTWTTCVSDADGDCNFTVPIRAGAISATGAPQDTRFWVVQVGTPTGFYTNPVMRVGGFGVTPEAPWQYRFRTDTQLRAGTVYASTTAMPWDAAAADPDRYFMRNRLDNNVEGSQSQNATRTTGVWSQSRTNPVLPPSCELDIALIADTSGSLGVDGIAALKGTMTSFVDAFRGTKTRMSLFSFSSVSPGASATNSPNLLPVTTAAQAADFKAQFATWAANGGTNWDAGFAAAANAAPHFNLAILLTDGNPTVIRSNAVAGSSAFNSLQDVDAGIFSANQLKVENTRLVAVGVGPALSADSEYNLRAVSGTTVNSDYYRAASFAEATAALTALANTNCQGSIGVQKMIVPPAGTIADATPAPAGWQFDATSNALTAVTVNAPATQLTTAGGNGKVDFGLTFPGATDSGAVQILETQQTGYSLVPVGAGAAARNATCVNVETGASVAVTNAGSAAQPGFVVNGQKNQRVECIIYNRAPLPGALTVEKSSNPATGASVVPGQNITYTLTFRNTGGLPVVVDQDDVLTDVLDDAALQGAITAQAPLSAALNPAGDRIRITGTLAAGTTRTVTYTVKVRDPLPAAANGVLRNAVVPTGQQPPTTCLPGAPCTVHPVKVNLTWNKVNLRGDRLVGSEWLLTPYTTAGALDSANAIAVIDCIAGTAAACTGRDTDPQAGGFLLAGLAPGTYRLAETRAPAGYVRLTQTIDVVVNTNVAYGDIKNTQIVIPGIPLTGGMGSLLFTGLAGGLGALAVVGLWWQRRKNRKATAA